MRFRLMRKWTAKGRLGLLVRRHILRKGISMAIFL